ncbi:DUF6507 family protein [Arthrobacter sp. zg-Y40]|uniref:DUF6507 family protein n=1 Tax=unclassified Arthrobacter TaxID=235627 RepID=UPI001D136B9C|nr:MULTISPECIES: DUF6507 family protein [unclassified Arthrobacter]MCC3279781.1 DUF6507 family protein [Arthrobacter sp. zg-Y40]MDK1328149.1 DUF6507 family protein [Arthrobacter sp. zg-Y1143]
MPINGWDIQVDVVRGVIEKARVTVEDLQAEETTLQDAVSSAAGSTNSPVILSAMTECYEDYLSRLVNSGTVRAGNACNSTGDAVNHYVSGDAEMAGNANQSAGGSSLTSLDDAPAGALP